MVGRGRGIERSPTARLDEAAQSQWRDQTTTNAQIAYGNRTVSAPALRHALVVARRYKTGTALPGVTDSALSEGTAEIILDPIREPVAT